MKKIHLLALTAFFAVSISAQSKMRIWMGDVVAYEQNVTQIDSVTFVLENNEGALSGGFSVSPTKKIRFSKGNLQFNPGQGSHQCADGSTQQGTWRFAEHQWDLIKNANDYASATYDGWLDLFAWGSSGYNDRFPYLKNNEYDDSYFINYQNDISGTMYDWGLYNEISNGGAYGSWRTPTAAEYEYILSQRPNAKSLQKLNVKVNGVEGFILFPDDWDISVPINSSYSLEEWEYLEAQGVAFFPDGGIRDYTLMSGSGWFYGGHYWTGTCTQSQNKAFALDTYNQSAMVNEHAVSHGRSVRLVQDVE